MIAFLTNIRNNIAGTLQTPGILEPEESRQDRRVVVDFDALLVSLPALLKRNEAKMLAAEEAARAAGQEV